MSLCAPAAALVGAAAAVAVVDWYAVARQRAALERVAKPAVVVLLIAAALTLAPRSAAERAAFVVALGCGLAGDVLLLDPDDGRRFLGGLGAFLLGHGAYLAGLAQVQDSGAGQLAGVAVVVLLTATLGRRVVRGAHHRAGGLAAPVAAYLLVLCGVVVLGLGTGRGTATAGVLLFASSDGVLGLRQFVVRRGWMDPAVAVTYHLAQGLLVLSLA